MRRILAVLPLVLLAGCSSFRPDAENITPVPGDRLLAYQDEFQNGGRLVVNRDMGLMGGGCYVAIEVDRKLAARIGMAEVASFRACGYPRAGADPRPAGRHPLRHGASAQGAGRQGCTG